MLRVNVGDDRRDSAHDRDSGCFTTAVSDVHRPEPHTRTARGICEPVGVTVEQHLHRNRVAML